MTDRPDTPKDPKRPTPAPVDSIVASEPAPETNLPGPSTRSTAEPAQAIESTLVGNGDGLPAMDRREAPLRLQQAATPETPDASLGTNIPPAREPEPQPEHKTESVKATTSHVPPVSRPAPPPAPAARKRGGFMATFLGGVAAAALGAGATYWAIPRLPAAWQPTSVPVVDTAALTEAAVTAARAEIDTRAAAIETRAVEAATQAATAATDAADRASGASLAAADREGLLTEARQAGADAAAKLIAEAPSGPEPQANVEATLAAQAQQLAALDQRLGELGTQTPQAGGSVPPVDLAPLQQQVQELAQRPALDTATVERLTKLAADAEAATARINAAAKEAEARLSEAEGRAEELRAAADEAAKRARTAAAAAAIGEAVQTGAPPTEALAQLKEAGVEPPAALTVEIPTLDVLNAEFPDAARAALRADLKTSSAQGQGSLIGNFLRAQTGARSVAPREGTDTDAVLSRAGDAVARGAVDEALNELNTLPEPARPAMEAWTAKARAYVDAQSALNALTAPAEAASAAEAAPTATPSN